MAEIKSFPNNQDEYIGAEDVMRWHHGRTSGVFGADGNAAVSKVLDTMKVAVSDGNGWLTDANGNGIVWWVDNEAKTDKKLELAVDIADAVLTRIDRVVVSWGTTNYVSRPEIMILKGTPASNPVPPALTNNSMVRQISLAQIRIPAGASSMNECVVVDERLDASVCGIVTERVGIDTSVMEAQFKEFYEKSIAEQNAYIEAQAKAWEAFFSNVQEDTIVPVPGASDKGKAVIVNEDGNGYALANIQTEIPITSEVPADADMWIDPTEPSGAAELGFDSGELSLGTQKYFFPTDNVKFATVTLRVLGVGFETVIVDCSAVPWNYDMQMAYGGCLRALRGVEGQGLFEVYLEGADTAVSINRVCGYGYVGGGEESSVEVVQTTGDSETAVMSQKAVTAEITDINGRFEFLFEPVDVKPPESEWSDLGYVYGANGELGYNQYVTGSRAVKIQLLPKMEYEFVFYGYYLLYDKDGKNGVQTNKNNYDKLVLNGGEEGRYVALNCVMSAHSIEKITMYRTTPTAEENENMPFAMPRLVHPLKTLQGKTVVNFGDSIFGQARPPYDISTKLAELTGATVHNCGFGGCQMSWHSNENYQPFSMYQLADAIATNDWTLQDAALQNASLPSYFGETIALLKSLDFSKVDIVTLGYGINDFNNGSHIDDSDSTSNHFACFGYAMRYSIEKLLTAFPNLRIFVCTMTYWWNATGDTNSFEHKSWVGDGRTAKYTEWVEQQKTIAKEYQLPVIDNYYDLGINKVNGLQYFSESDTVHHAQNGRDLIAEHMAKKLW